MKVVRRGRGDSPSCSRCPSRRCGGWARPPSTRLARLGVTTVGDLAAAARRPVVTGSLGNAVGLHLHALANGIDDRAVEPDRPVKSVGHEETFARDHHTHASLERELVRLSDAVGSPLARPRPGRSDRHPQGALQRLPHDHPLQHVRPRPPTRPPPSPGGRRTCWPAVDPTPGVRLIGVSVSGLADGVDPPAQPRRRRLRPAGTTPPRPSTPSASGSGAAAIGPATLADRGDLRVRREGEAPWGPGDVEGRSRLKAGSPR